MRSMPPAQQLLLEHRVDGIVRIPADFSRHIAAGRCRGAAHRARRRRQPRAHHRGLRAGRGRDLGSTAGGAGTGDREPAPVNVQARLWFNEANDSSYFLVPGLIVLVMTLIGGLLTAMVMAREWERGTLEALLVTPVRSDEILLGKTLPYFVLGPVRLRAVRAVGEVPVPRAAARLVVGAVRRLDAVRAGRARHRAADLLLGQESVRRQPAHDARHLHAGVHAVGISVRPAQHAGRGAPDHLCAAGALLRGAAAERVSRRRCLVGDRAEHARAGGDGRRARPRQPRGHAQEPRIERACSTPAAYRWL